MARSEVSIAIVLAAFCFGACLAQTEECTPTYTIMEEDTFNQIAARFRVTVSDLEDANPDVTDIDKIRAGSELNIPCDVSAPILREPNPSDCAEVLEVKKGDTIYNIGQKRDVTIQQIRDVNPNLVDIENLYIGQKILIPPC